jgi:proteasome lid subunit RPN8/RPN11
MTEIVIGKEHLEDIVSHALEAGSQEACGLLGGSGNRVERVFRMRNTDASPVSYGFDPGEQLRVLKLMKEEGLDMVAIYHSHPASEAYPSQTDVSRAFFPGTRELNHPGTAYVIVGLAGNEPEVRAYTITGDGGIVPVRVVEH